MGYVIAVTGLTDHYGLKLNLKYKYFVDVIEDTHAEVVEGGYQVLLYSYAAFGCGPHPTYAVDFHVTPEGYIQQIGMEKVFRDPREDGLCTD